MIRYKDRNPAETVSILSDFFSHLSDHISLTESPVRDGSIGVYSLSVTLSYDGRILLRSNGKGMEPAFAKASAYAELYERFCNRYSPTGYFYDVPDSGSEDGFDQEMSCFPSCTGRTDDFIRYLKAENPRIFPRPFQPLLKTDKTVLLDPRHIFTLCGSNGMAAGNTLEEALVQAISELAERFVMCRCLAGEPLILHRIPDSVLSREAPESYAKVSAIRSAGFSIDFYDASFATGLPVILSLWIARDQGVHSVRFGAFPVFSIAIERCITEQMQGRGLTEFHLFRQNSPYIGAGRMEFYEMMRYGDALLPESLFFNAFSMAEPEKTASSPTAEWNEAVYLRSAENSQDLLDYYRTLAAKEHFHLYYRDVSLLPALSAVHVYSPELNSRFPVEHLLLGPENMEAITHFLAHPEVTSIEHAAGLLNMLETSASIPDAICARFHTCGLGAWAYVYIIALLSYCTGDYVRASTLLDEITTTGGFESLPPMSALKTWLRYRAAAGSAAACGACTAIASIETDVQRKLALWGYLPDELDHFFHDPVAVCNSYLSDVLFGDIYHANKILFDEMNHLFERQSA